MSIIAKNDRLIDSKTNEYNLTLAQVSDRLYREAVEAGTGSAPTFGSSTEEAEVEAFGYFKVHPTPRPVGDWYEVTPVKSEEDGKYHQTWKEVIPEPVNEEAVYEATRQERIAKVKEITAAAQEQGCPIDFGEQHGVLHVQMRPSNDSTHILVLRVEADEAVAAGVPEQVHILRTTENINVELMAQEVISVSKVYSKQYKQVMGWNWNLVDALRAAVFPEPLVEVPGEIGLQPLKYDSEIVAG